MDSDMDKKPVASTLSYGTLFSPKPKEKEEETENSNLNDRPDCVMM